MAQYFGKTWWGEQFLNSLSHIDFENRLQRGSRYARNGSVKSIKIDSNKITAKVQGTARSPYSVTIIIPPFFETDIKRLIKEIALKPAMVSKLLNRELDPEILEIAERNGLKVFPEKWSDFKMQCSCPDWAVPCKHLAAVIYMLSHEIDNNPFLVFDLHRVDLPAELKKEKIFIEDILQEEIPSLRKLFRDDSKTKQDASERRECEAEGAYSKLDFSDIHPIGESLIQLLQAKPPFYSGISDFREKYASAMKKTVRNAQLAVKGRLALDKSDELKKAGKKVKQPVSIISRHYDYYMLLDGSGNAGIQKTGTDEIFSITEFMAELWRMPHSQLLDYQPSVPALHSSLQFALNLLANGAVVPMIVLLDNKKYGIRWNPALLSREVKSVASALREMLPEGIVRITQKKNITGQPELYLVSAWLDALVPSLSGLSGDDFILNMFFADRPHSFSGPAQRATAGGIQSWLKRYYITASEHIPVIVVEEKKGTDDFLVHMRIRPGRKSLNEPFPLAEVISSKKHESIRFEVLQSVSQLSLLMPGLDQYINSGAVEPLCMKTGEFGGFLMDSIPAIKLLDIDVILPRSLQSILRPQPSVKIKRKKQSSGMLRLDSLFDFDWQVAIGDTVINEKEFKKLVEKSEGLIRFKGGYIYAGPGDLEKLHKHFNGSRKLDSLEMLRISLSEEYNGARVSLADDVKSIIRELTSQGETDVPSGLMAELRPYQKRGYSWLWRNSRIGFGSVIADDMGLGKTLQVIALLLKFKDEGFLKKERALVVVPTGLLANWQAELDRFAPDLRYMIYHGAGRELNEKHTAYDLLLTSYGTCRSDVEKLRKLKWNIVIIDEAQNIKNSDTAQSRAIKSISADTYIAMSGTPVENNLTELWNIVDFSNRGLLGGISEFREYFGNPIQFQNDSAAAERLKKVTAPFMLRRLKSDKKIISDLPDKIEIDSYCNLTAEQASLYEKTLQKAMEAIESISGTDRESLFKRQGLVLQMILALKQVCNHPAQYLKNRVLESAISGKTEMLLDRLDTVVESNEKVLVFTQFTEMGELLKHFIYERFGESPLYYHGGCSIKQRKEMVDLFQNNRADKIFILSLKAGGTGLNLTAASHVIHYDLWWNPAVEAQATDRAYRIGQKSNVMVYRFITKGTFEERINEMIQRKKHLADMTISAGENWIGNLSNRELKDIFELGI